MENDTPVAGFQFNLSGISITGVSGGSSEANGFIVSGNNETVIGFSLTGSTLPPGEATLVEVAFTGTPNEICITDEVLSAFLAALPPPLFLRSGMLLILPVNSIL